jgi:hypothetical protein
MARLMAKPHQKSVISEITARHNPRFFSQLDESVGIRQGRAKGLFHDDVLVAVQSATAWWKCSPVGEQRATASIAWSASISSYAPYGITEGNSAQKACVLAKLLLQAPAKTAWVVSAIALAW